MELRGPKQILLDDFYSRMNDLLKGLEKEAIDLINSSYLSHTKELRIREIKKRFNNTY